MQRLWSVISTTFLIQCSHWFLLYWIEYSFPSKLTPSSSSMDRRFAYRAIFLRQCRFQNVLSPPPPPVSRLEAAEIFLPTIVGVPWNQLCWQTHNCPRFEKKDNMNDTEAFITKLCGAMIVMVIAIWQSPPPPPPSAIRTIVHDLIFTARTSPGRAFPFYTLAYRLSLIEATWLKNIYQTLTML